MRTPTSSEKSGINGSPEERRRNSSMTFEDMSFLYEDGGRGQSRIDPEEGRLLFDTAKAMKEPLIVEIGRLLGGTTILLARSNPDGVVLSIDIKENDPVFRNQLEEMGIENVIIATGNAGLFPNKHLSVDLLFIDGDHSKFGCLRDFYTWFPRVKEGGHIIFHDASGYNSDIGCVEATDELVKKGILTNELPKVLSMRHFIK
jgi:predicted O-methyltransferase YrrM